MTTKLLIYKGVLRKLGEPTIAALTDEGKGRRAIDSAYDEMVSLCLKASFWNFAIRTVELSYDEDVSPLFGYQYAFSKPSDWVRTAAFSADEYFTVPELRYEDTVGYWYADIDPVYVKYVSNDASFGMDLGSWPDDFTQYVQYMIAHEICEDVTGSTSKKDALKKDVRIAKRDAINKDSMDDPATKFPPTGRLLQSRFENRSSREGRYRAG